MEIGQLDLAAFLYAKGVPLVCIKPTDTPKRLFVFEDNVRLQTEMNEFLNNGYVKSQDYWNAIKRLKEMVIHGYNIR